MDAETYASMVGMILRYAGESLHVLSHYLSTLQMVESAYAEIEAHAMPPEYVRVHTAIATFVTQTVALRSAPLGQIDAMVADWQEQRRILALEMERLGLHPPSE